MKFVYTDVMEVGEFDDLFPPTPVSESIPPITTAEAMPAIACTHPTVSDEHTPATTDRTISRCCRPTRDHLIYRHRGCLTTRPHLIGLPIPDHFRLLLSTKDEALSTSRRLFLPDPACYLPVYQAKQATSHHCPTHSTHQTRLH